MAANKFFPTLLIILDLGAAFIYVLDGDWRRTIYWFAAAVLTPTVTI
jgi:hypothetical protein